MVRSIIIALSAVVFLLVQGICGRLYSDPQTSFDQYNPDAVAGFTRSLISKREYYRAFTELRRLRELYPGYISTGKFRTTELYLLFQGKRFDDIIALDVPDAGKRLQCIYTLFAFDSWIYMTDGIPDPSFLRAGCARKKDCEPILSEMIMRRYLLTGLAAGRGRVSAPDACAVDVAAMLNDQRYSELKRYAHERYDSLRSPSLSVLMGIVPGLGYARGGNRATGIIAFVAVALGSVLTVVASKTDNTPLAIVFGLGTGVFYTGSILGGYRETLRFNRETERQTLETLAEKLNLAGDREKIMNLYGLGDGGNR